MDSPAHVPTSESVPFWTDEKHVQFLNTMEASFVRTMFENNGGSSSHHHHHHQLLPLDRQLPDCSESTLDLKPRRRTRKHHAPSDSMGPRARTEGRRTRKRPSSSQPCNSSQDQVVPHVENGRKGAARNGEDDKSAEK